MTSQSVAHVSSPLADAPDLNAFAPAATTSAPSEPQWLINRRANKTDSGLLRLPNEILLEIIILTSLDRVSLYMIRQVCHCFADLFSSAAFEPFRERGFSVILGRNQRQVELESMPLTAVRARLIDVAFSYHTKRARRILMRDFGPQLVETKGPENGEVLLEEEDLNHRKICNYCACSWLSESNMHNAVSFPSSQRKLSDKYMRACEEWFGNINACSHCNYDGKSFQFDRRQFFYFQEHEEDASPGRSECLWECTSCFDNLLPEGVDILKRYPSTERPHIVMKETGQSNYQQFTMYFRWKMPLFASAKVDGRPTSITYSMIQSRLVELSEGPCEDLIRLCLGPLHHFATRSFFPVSAKTK